jgi:phosphatidylserine/phosphatidylglycerophosphate/cardiolipin synthase-like enzyme
MVKDKLQVAGTVRGVFFSLGTTPSKDPQLDCAKALIDLFNQAETVVHIAIYSLTNEDIVNAIIAAHNRGIEISMVVDAGESRTTSQSKMISKLSNEGIDIKLTVRQHALMHNKVGIFDHKIVATGSFNWTYRAEKSNDENLVVLEGTEIADAYEKYMFQRILKNETEFNAI